MEDKVILTHGEVFDLCRQASEHIPEFMPGKIRTCIYGIPRGGIPVAYILSGLMGYRVTNDPEEAHYFVDDLIDSGVTCEKYCDQYPERPFIALMDKRDVASPFHKKWVVFPWEETAEAGIEDHIARLIQYCGEDPTRGGLVETPARVAKAFSFYTSGYDKDPETLLKTFEDGGENYDEMVTVKDIPFYSQCEHHLAPFFGTVTISYIPQGKIVGLSKLSRLADMFARRLQVQERMTNQIADAIMKHLKPRGVGVMVKARHMCMESRGVCQQGHHTITTSVQGAFRGDAATRQEFMAVSRGIGYK